MTNFSTVFKLLQAKKLKDFGDLRNSIGSDYGNWNIFVFGKSKRI